MTKQKTSIGVALVLILLLTLAVAGGAWYAFQLPANTADATVQRVVIPSGSSTQDIAQKLKDAGLVRFSVVFRLLVKQQGLEGKLQAGSFQLSADMTPSELAVALTQSTSDTWVTIPEGLRTEEIAQLLAKKDLPSFQAADFLSEATGKEGRLFPDTYLIPQESTAGGIVRLLTNTFDQKLNASLSEQLESSKRSVADVVIMASILEREATGADEMAHVAGILWNRIDLGMPLQVDATLQYAKGNASGTQDWWAVPRSADRQIDSPYNTYVNLGLPPKPISNPGLAALTAALLPQETDDLFYLHDAKGVIHYAQTYAQHQSNINTYLR